MSDKMVYLEDAEAVRTDARELNRSIKESRDWIRKIRSGLQTPEGENRIVAGSVVYIILMSYLKHTLYDIPAEDMIEVIMADTGWDEREVRYVLKNLALE